MYGGVWKGRGVLRWRGEMMRSDAERSEDEDT